jgi:hypothetical protein
VTGGAMPISLVPRALHDYWVDKIRVYVFFLRVHS